MLGQLELPLFPLHAVMFNGSRLTLQIFEPRYLSMVRRCLQKNTGFGVVLIESGNDAKRTASDPAPKIAKIGTYVSIAESRSLRQGRIGIVVEGSARIRIGATWELEDGLMMGFVAFDEDEPLVHPAKSDRLLVDLLRGLVAAVDSSKTGRTIDYEDLREVSLRLSEFLPFDLKHKQKLLIQPTCRARMDLLLNILNDSRDD